MTDMVYTYVATCLFGLEKVLGEEIDALGLKRIHTMDGRVTFEGDENACARANVGLRCAERVYLKLGSFRATTYTELFDGTAALPWPDFIGRKDAFPVKGHAIRSTLFSVPDCQSIIKKAVVRSMSQAYREDWFEETGIKYQIEFFLFKDEAALMIDTTGTPLHKRGYRPEAGIAPLRETLAAGLVKLSRLRQDTMLWDPFCGSGTIVIEATLDQCRIAPGLSRSFASESFPFIGSKVFEEEKERAKAQIVTDSEIMNWGSDIDSGVLKTALQNASRAGIEKKIRFFQGDATRLSRPDRRGTVICNPPYGERMMDIREVEAMYRQLGRCQADYAPWQIYILTSCETFEKLYGRKANKVRKLYNGMIPCYLYEFFK